MSNEKINGKWRNFDNLPSSSFYDYLYQQITLNRIDTNIFFGFLELFWPTFIVYKNYVFLKNSFTEERFKELENQRDDKMIEYWMNLLTVDPYFENVEDGDEKATFISKSLVEIWQEKLKKDFPNKKFIVKYVHDDETGDYGLTFYQKKEGNTD